MLQFPTWTHNDALGTNLPNYLWMLQFPNSLVHEVRTYLLSEIPKSLVCWMTPFIRDTTYLSKKHGHHFMNHAKVILTLTHGSHDKIGWYWHKNRKTYLIKLTNTIFGSHLLLKYNTRKVNANSTFSAPNSEDKYHKLQIFGIRSLNKAFPPLPAYCLRVLYMRI